MKSVIINDKCVGFIGKDKYDNDNIYDIADINDIWFHLADYSSPHIWINCPMNKHDIYKVALYLKKNSKNNKYKKELIRVMYTKKSNIQKTNKPGTFVLTGKAKYIVV